MRALESVSLRAGPGGHGVRETVEVVLAVVDTSVVDGQLVDRGDSVQAVDRDVGGVVDVDDLVLAVRGIDAGVAVVVLGRQSKISSGHRMDIGRTEKKL